MNFKKISSILLLFILLFVSCNNSKVENVSCNNSKVENISVENLMNKEHICYENYIFLHEDKNYVYKVENNNIVDCKVYDIPKEINIDEEYELFISLVGKNFLDVIDIIGLPTYRLSPLNNILVYSKPIRYLYNVEISKNLIIKKVSRHNKDSFGFFGVPIVDLELKKVLPSEKEIDKIKIGSCFDEIIILLGNPQDILEDEENYTKTFIYSLKNDKQLRITFWEDKITKDCEHAKYSVELPHNTWYWYVKSYQII